MPQYQVILQDSSQGVSGAIDSPASHTHGLLAVFSSLWVVGPRASVPHWMLARGLPQFLAQFLTQLITWQPVSLRASPQERAKEDKTEATALL